MALKNATVIALFILILVVASSFVVLDEETEKTKSEYNLDSYIVRSSLEGDFPNKKQGSFVYQGNLNNEMLESRSDVKYIILFYSRKIPGLAMRYNLQDKTIEAGLPVIKSEPVDLLNKDKIRIVYSFKEDAEQKVILNGKKLMSSPYTGSPGGMLTGFVVSQKREEFGIINIPGSMVLFSPSPERE